MALKASGAKIELREILLRDKPAEMLLISEKGTVPVLQLPSGHVLDESYDIMHWAVQQEDPYAWLAFDKQQLAEIKQLVFMNDFEFKGYLDHYKYADRYPQHSQDFYRQQGEGFLQKLEVRLKQNRYLMADKVSLADIAIMPFIRQFAYVDIHWFDSSPYQNLRKWLNEFLESELFLSIMPKYPPWKKGCIPIYV